MRVAAHLVAGGRSLGHELTLPEEDTSVTQNSYGPHILLFSFHSFIFDFFKLEEYPLHKLHSVELSDGCSQTHSEETETPFVNRLLKMLTGIIFLHSHKIFSFFSFKLATAGWTQLGIHHLILQTAPQFLLSQLILSASPPMNPPGHARIYELE